MFQKLVEAIRKVVSRLLSKESAGKALSVDLSVSDKMTKKIDLWTKMYEDKPPWSKECSTMGLPAAIAGEIARLVTLEMKSEITDGKRAEVLNQFYKKLMTKIRTEVEYAVAKGGMVFKPYVSGNKISISCHQADSVLPVEFGDDGELLSAIFVEKFTQGNAVFTKLEYHQWNGNGCTITNKAYENKFSNGELGTEISLGRVSRWADIDPIVKVDNLECPLFSYFKMPIANAIDSQSDVGVSVYSRAEKLIEDADEMYSRILWEYEGSELAIDADESALRVSGNQMELPKKEQRLFRRVGLDGKTGDFYNVFSPEIRDSSLFNGLNKLLQRIEFACGLAYGTISDVNEAAKTATEILASKQRSYSLVADIQTALQNSLEGLIVSMDALCDLYNLAPKGEYEVSFEFDDSLIMDSAAEQAIMLQEVQAGIIKPEIYLTRRYGLTEEQIQEWMPETTKEDDVEEE